MLLGKLCLPSPLARYSYRGAEPPEPPRTGVAACGARSSVEAIADRSAPPDFHGRRWILAL